ncbi:hypothetical protein Avbf_14379 [Armadillidium vulgare]|nr:hypothetical protein Avbf_14379 [Armadillidium vulgare]
MWICHILSVVKFNEESSGYPEGIARYIGINLLDNEYETAKDMPSISPLDRKISSSEKNLNIPDDDSGESGLCNDAYEEEKEAPDENLDAYKTKEETNQESEKKDVEVTEESSLHEKVDVLVSESIPGRNIKYR